MKVYRLLNHLSLCALLLSCAMPALGSAPAVISAESSEKGSYTPPVLPGTVEKVGGFSFVSGTPVQRTEAEFKDAVKNALDELNAIKGNSPELAAQRRAARQKWLDAKTALEEFGQAPVAIHTPAESPAAAMPVAQPAATESWMAWSGRIAAAPFKAARRGAGATASALGNALIKLDYALDLPKRAVIGAAGYAAYPFVRAYSAIRGTSVEIPVSDKIQNALLKAKFKDNEELTKLQEAANAQIAANKQDATVDPSAAVQAFLNAAQSHRPAKDILVRMLAPEAQKRIQAASDEYAKLKAKNASEAELDEAMQAMQEATEELELIRSGGVGLGGVVVSEEGEVLNTPEKEKLSVSYPIDTFPEAAPAVVRARPETLQAELAAVKSAIAGKTYGPMTYRDYMAAQRQARAQQPQRTARGALTGAGQMARLEQRQASETARRIQNSILANNSVPTADNLDQWVREFVNMYESPYVLSKLNQSEKEQYIALIKEFFRKAQLSGDFNPNEVALLYDRLIQGSPRLQEAIQTRLEPWMEQQAEAAEQEFDESRAQLDQASAERIAAEKTAAENPSTENVAMAKQAKAAEQQAVQKTQSKYMKVLKWTAAAAIVGGATYLGVSWLTGSDPKAVKENFSTLANWSYNHGGKLKEKIFGKKAVGDYDPEVIPAEPKTWTQTLSLGYLGNPKSESVPAAAASKKGWIEWGTMGYFGKPKGADVDQGRLDAMLDDREYEGSATPRTEMVVEPSAPEASAAPSAPALTPAASAPVKAAAPAGRGMMERAMDVGSKGKKAYGAYAAYKEAAKEAADLLIKGKDVAAVQEAAQELGIATGGKVPLRAKIQAYYQSHPWAIPADIISRKGLPVVAPLAIDAVAASAK